MKRLDTELSSKELKEMSGIYKIQCKDRIYVGSSKSLYSRLAEYRSKLHNDRHSNDFLQKNWNKYGPDSFKYEILEFCDPEGEKLIEGNIKDLNNFFAQQILNGNWEISIRIRPKTKVPFKLCELLEQLEKANQKPIPVRNSGQVQRLDKVYLPGSAEVEISTSAKNIPMSTKT